MKKKPNLLLKNNLLFPLNETEKRMLEIEKESTKETSEVVINGLYIMAVSYLESMIREILTYYLKHYPKKIPGNKVKIDKNKVGKYEDFDFLEKIISDHLKMMSFKDLGRSFFKILDIKKPHKIIKEIVEIKDMRNSLVHNNLTVDYKMKIAKNGKNIGKKKLNSCIRTYMDFIDVIRGEINKKYSAFTRINLFKKLWDYTFKTPLCANIEDYWVLDKKKDIIFAIKHPSQEKSLSHSEKFLLDIWRGQLNNYKVEFLNMSSLGSHAQSCLYLFLKVSNDLFMYQ